MFMHFVTRSVIAASCLCMFFKAECVQAQDIVILTPFGTIVEDDHSPEAFRLSTFPATPVGSEYARLFLIGNLDNTTLTIALPPFTNGSNPQDFSLSILDANIKPFNLTYFVVKFSPSAIGTRSATINLSSNDPDEGSFQLNLSGSGYTVLPPATPDLAVTMKKEAKAKFDSGVNAFLARGRFEVQNNGSVPMESGNAEIFLSTTAPYFLDSSSQLIQTIPFGPIKAKSGNKPGKLKLKFKDLDIGNPLNARLFIRVKPLQPSGELDYVDNQAFNYVKLN